MDQFKVGDLIKVQWNCHWLIPKGDYSERRPITIPIIGIFVNRREYGACDGGFFGVTQLLVGDRIAEMQDNQIVSIELLQTPS